MKRKSCRGMLLLVAVLLAFSGCGRKKANEHFSRGTVYLQKKQYAEARTEYEEALRIYPKHPQAYYGIGVVAMAQGQYEEALEKFKKALELKEDFSGAYYQIARTQIMLNEVDQALTALEKAIQLDAEKWRPEARSDRVLARIKDNARFKELVGISP